MASVPNLWAFVCLSSLAYSLAFTSITAGLHLNCSSSWQSHNDDSASSLCTGVGYRSGLCEDCDCCPECWSCAELLHYDCARQNGLEVVVINMHKSVQTGQYISWSLVAEVPPEVTAESPSELDTGWLQCVSLPALPPGLYLSGSGVLRGKVEHDASQPVQYHRDVFVFNTRGWQRTRRVVRLELSLSIHNTVDMTHDSQAYDTIEGSGSSSDAARQAEEQGRQAFRLYEQYAQGRLGYRETIEGMKTHLASLHNVLSHHPLVADGLYWAWLGAAHMSIHKLTENVLPECERFLEQALLFPSQATERLARQNLDGCLGKRRLEAAKFMFFEGMRLMERGQWQAAVAVLSRAAAKKDGWGWAVNQGEIHTALAGAELVMWVDEVVAKLVPGAPVSHSALLHLDLESIAVHGTSGIMHDETAADSPHVSVWEESLLSNVLLEQARTHLTFAQNRAPGHAWTVANAKGISQLGDGLARRLADPAHFTAAEVQAFATERQAFVNQTLLFCQDTLQSMKIRPRPLPQKQTPWFEDIATGWGSRIPTAVISCPA